MAAVTDLPLIAKPNAGLPALNERGETVYEMGAEAFAEEMESLQKAGASILAGAAAPRRIISAACGNGWREKRAF